MIRGELAPRRAMAAALSVLLVTGTLAYGMWWSRTPAGKFDGVRMHSGRVAESAARTRDLDVTLDEALESFALDHPHWGRPENAVERSLYVRAVQVAYDNPDVTPSTARLMQLDYMNAHRASLIEQLSR